MVTLMIGVRSVCGVIRAVSARDDIGGSTASRVLMIEVAERARSRCGRVVSAVIGGAAIAGDSDVASLAM